jgi:hypothetical protein
MLGFLSKSNSQKYRHFYLPQQKSGHFCRLNRNCGISVAFHVLLTPLTVFIGGNNMFATSTATPSQKAALTRKRNKYEAKRDQAIQSARRHYLYEQLTDVERESVEDELLSATSGLDEELEEWLTEKEWEAKEVLRSLLRKGVKAAIILASIENSDAPAEFSTGRGGFSFNLKDLLNEVLIEVEFLGMNGSTPEEREKRWNATDRYISQEEVPGMDESEYDIPPALTELVTA